MKKLTFLLTALLLTLASATWAAVGSGEKLTSLEQLDNTEAFTFSTNAYGGNRGALVAVGDAVYSTTNQNITVDANSEAQQFAIVKYNDAYYLFNIDAQKFMNKGDGANAVLSTIGEPVTLQYADGGYWKIYFKGNRLNLGDGGNMAINDWDNDDAGNKFDITSVGDASASITAAQELLNTKEVTFNVYFGSELKATATAKASIGKAPELPASLKKDFAVYTCDVETVSETTTEVNFTYSTFDGPFKVSASYDEAVWYFLKIRGKYTAWDATAQQSKNTDGKVTDDNGQWAFTGNPYDGFKLYNKSTRDGYTLQVADDNNNTEAKIVADEGFTWQLPDRGKGQFMLFTGSNYINDNGGRLALWNAAYDTGSYFTAEAVPQAALTDVTYNIIYNGSQVATATVQQYTGEDPELPGSLNLSGLCTYTFDSDAPITANATYNVTATWDGPFNFSTSYADAEWKNLTIRGTKYVNYGATEPYANVENASDALRATDEYQWAFLGNPYAVVIINKAAGASKSLTLEGAYFVLRDGQNGQLIAKSGDGFAVIVRNTDGNVQTTLNDNSSKLGTWDGEHITDGGSCLRVADVPEPDYAAAVAEAVTPWMESAGKPFGLKQSIYDAYASTYTAALESCDKATYDELVAAVTAADAINEPETGYYRIYNTSDRWKTGKGYIGVKGNGTLSANIIANGAADNDIKVSPEWAATVIRVEKVEGGYTFAIDGKYIGEPNGDASLVPLADEPVVYTYELYQPAVVKLQCTTNDQWLHRGIRADKDIIAWYENGPSDFQLEAAEEIQVPLNTVGSESYATLCVPFEVTADANTTAYTIAISEDKAVGTAVEGSIAAGTPVVLVGTEATATFTIGEGYVAEPATTDLVGNYLPVAVNENDLVLGVNDADKVGFYKWDGTTIAANRAYIAATAGARAFVLDLDGATTGISTVLNAKRQADAAVYDLNGSRRQGLKKGLNIVRTENGTSKVIIK